MSYENNKDVGTATINITFQGNYTGTATKTFRIIPGQLFYRIVLEDGSSIYDGQAKYAAYTIYVYKDAECNELFTEIASTNIAGTDFADMNIVFKYVDSDGSFGYKMVIPSKYTITIESIKLNEELSDIYTFMNTGEESCTYTIEKATYDMSNVFFNDKSVTYTGDAYSITVTGTLPVGVTVSYTNNGKTEFGTYTITANFTGSEYYNSIESMTATLTIGKATPVVSTKPTLSTILEGGNATITQGVVKNSAGTETVKGEFRYIESTGTSAIPFVPGVYTDGKYVTKVTLRFYSSNANYSNFDYQVDLTMLPLAYIGTTSYGTVEKALDSAVSGNKVNVVMLSTISQFVSSIELSGSEIVIKSGVTLILPVDTSLNEYNKLTTTLPPESQSLVVSSLTIAEGTTLRIYGNLVVSGEVYSDGTVRKRGVLMNNGNIILESGATFNSYGYTKGIGMIESMSGATVTDIFKMYDWVGGKNAYALNEIKILPFKCYSIHNISCDIKFNYGSVYKSKALLYVSDSWIDENMIMVGSSGLFELKNGYIIKEVEDTTVITNINTDMYSTNQNITQRDILRINGDFIDGAVELTVKISLLSADIKTSTELAMPIGFFKIFLESGTGSLSQNSYQFLPGSELYIGEDATLNIAKDVHIMFYDEFADDWEYIATKSATTGTRGKDNGYSYQNKHSAIYTDGIVNSQYYAKLTVEGTLNCNGYLGGKVYGSGNGRIYIANNNAKLKEITQLHYDGTSINLIITSVDISSAAKTDVPKTAIGNINNTPNKQFSSGVTYYYNTDYNTWGSQIVISFVTNCDIKINTITEQTGSIGYSINSDILNSLEKEYYDFAGWYKDASFTTPYSGDMLHETTTLYAKWTPTNYNIEYVNVSEETITSEITNNNLTQFNYETLFEMVTATNDEFTCIGYYLNSTLTEEIGIIDGEALVNYLNDNTVTIYVKWKKGVAKTYTVNFANSNDAVSCQSKKDLQIMDPEDWINQGSLPTMTGKDYDENVSLYFIGWKDASGNIVTSITEALFAEGEFTTTLTATWGTKVEIKFNYSSGSSISKWSYNNSSITVPDVEATNWVNKSDYIVHANYEWRDSANNLYSAGSTITLTANTTITSTITSDSIKYYKFTFTLSNATVEINVSSSYGIVTDTSGNIKTSSSFSSNGTCYVQVGASATISVSYSKNNSRTFNVDGSLVSGTSTTITVTGTTHTVNASSSGSSCLVAGTLVTMADGTYKKVEDIVAGDIVLVFNHDTGSYDYSVVMYNIHSDLEWNYYEIINLEFSNGTTTRYHNLHYFFDVDLNEYVLLDHSNYYDYIGHRFYSASFDGTYYESEIITLTNAYATYEYTGVYGPMTAVHLNLFSDGLLSIAGDNDPFVNIFELDENMMIDETKKQQDIEMYGLFTYDDFKDYISEEIYYAYQGQYLKIAIGKGYTTFDRILELIEKYLVEAGYGQSNGIQ